MAKDQADRNRRDREAVTPCEEADNAKDQRDPDIEQRGAQRVGADDRQGEDDRPENGRWHQRDAGKQLGGIEAHRQEDDVGDQHRAEDLVDGSDLLGEQIGTRTKPVHHQADKDDGGGTASRDAQNHGRHHRTAGGCIVRRFGTGNALDRTLAELLAVFRPSPRLGITDHRGHGRTLGRQDADEGADAGRSRDSLPDFPVILARRQFHRLQRHHVGDPVRMFRLHQQFGDGEQADHHRHKGQAFIQLVIAEHETFDGGHALGTDGGEPDTENTADEVLDRPAGADTRQHRQAKDSQREILRWPEFIGHTGKQWRCKTQHDDREDSANRARNDSNAEGTPGLAALGQREAVKGRSCSRRCARRVDQDGGN